MTVLDPDVAAQLAEDLPPDVFALIVATFETDCARILAELSAAAEDSDAFARAAHTLAGAAAAVGARVLAELARRGMGATDGEDRAILLPLLRVQSRAAVGELKALAARPR